MVFQLLERIPLGFTNPVTRSPSVPRNELREGSRLSCWTLWSLRVNSVKHLMV